MSERNILDKSYIIQLEINRKQQHSIQVHANTFEAMGPTREPPPYFDKKLNRKTFYFPFSFGKHKFTCNVSHALSRYCLNYLLHSVMLLIKTIKTKSLYFFIAT